MAAAGRLPQPAQDLPPQRGQRAGCRHRLMPGPNRYGHILWPPCHRHPHPAATNTAISRRSRQHPYPLLTHAPSMRTPQWVAAVRDRVVARRGRVVARGGRVVGHRATRRGGRIAGVLAVALTGVALGVLLGGRITQDVGPFRAEFTVTPALHGGTEVAIPPLGSLHLATHSGPAHLSVRLGSLDQNRTKAIIVDPNGVTRASATAVDDVSTGLRRLALQVAGAGLLGAILLGAAVYR